MITGFCQWKELGSPQGLESCALIDPDDESLLSWEKKKKVVTELDFHTRAFNLINNWLRTYKMYVHSFGRE